VTYLNIYFNSYHGSCRKPYRDHFHKPSTEAINIYSCHNPYIAIIKTLFRPLFRPISWNLIIESYDDPYYHYIVMAIIIIIPTHIMTLISFFMSTVIMTINT